MSYLAIAATALTLLCLFGIWWIYREVRPLVMGGGPFVPTSFETVQQMINAAKLTPADNIVDLGSGDGRIVLEAVRTLGCRGLGVEIDPGLVRLSQTRAQEMGLEDNATFVQQDFWKTDLSSATVVFLFQVPRAMKRLDVLLKERLRPGSRIVSNYFIFPDWEPLYQKGEVTVYRVSK